jgi:Zn-dependent metalloprotease
MHPHVCSFACILPPHILDSIILKGTQRQRSRALFNRSLLDSFKSARIGYDESLRGERQSARAQRLLRQPNFLRALLAGTPQRTVRTAHNTQRTRGPIVRAEGDGATGDPAVDEAYDYCGSTYKFFWDVFQRDSINDAGQPLDNTVHFGQDYDNAYWDGQRMVYGDGDGEQFQRFTKCIDIIGHELAHGVTQHEAGLIYWGQAGALNESISDVFGSLVKQYANNQTVHQADWLIGQGLFTASVQGVAIRSLVAPGTAYNDPILGRDPQPAHMRDYERTLQDNGGVHINSGIPNHAFYLAAKAIGGYAWEHMGLIWYETLLSPGLRRNPTFVDFAELTVLVANELFPMGSEPEAVADAWRAVGITL